MMYVDRLRKDKVHTNTQTLTGTAQHACWCLACSTRFAPSAWIFVVVPFLPHQSFSPFFPPSDIFYISCLRVSSLKKQDVHGYACCAVKPMFDLMAAQAQFDPHHTYTTVPECERTSELQLAASTLPCNHRITLRCATFCSCCCCSSAAARSSPASIQALGSAVLGNNNSCSACVVCMEGKSWNLNPAWLLPLLSIQVPAGLPLPSCSTIKITTMIIRMTLINSEDNNDNNYIVVATVATLITTAMMIIGT